MAKKKNTSRKQEPGDDRRWLAAADKRLQMRGLAWYEENGGSFCRLPHRAKGRVRAPVWDLAQCPASGRLAFRSNTTGLAVRARSPNTNVMAHMPGSGSRGLSLYAGRPGRMRPWGAAIPDGGNVDFERQIFQGIPGKMREFRLYLPLYNGLESLELGFSKGARILPPTPPAIEGPVVIYGTSITQGGCASTAGSDFVSSVGRSLDLDVVNLGFSGNGRGEPELAELLAEIDASMYVLDYAANVDVKRLRYTLPRFVGILRKKHPTTPIVLLTNVCFWGYDFNAGTRRTLEDRRDAMIAFYARQRRAGDANLHLADGFGLVPYNTDAAYVDGVHPSDHGFQLMAERLAPIIERILLRDN